MHGGVIMSAAVVSMHTGVRLLVRQVGYQQRAFWRNRRAALFCLVFPLMFLVVFASLNHSAILDTRGGLSYIDFYVPGIIAYAVVLIGFNTTAMSFAALRTNGTLKRVRITPLPLRVYLGGAIVSTLAVIVAAVALMLAVGVFAFGAHIRLATFPSFIATLVLGSTCFTALGVSAARIISRPENGMGILMIFTMPVMFISNVFFPLDGAPEWLLDIARVFPIQPLADGMQVAFDPRTVGSGLAGNDLLVLAVWTVVGCVGMLRYMRSVTSTL
jgi:ABC-2 type transport system permease protein